VLKCFFPEVSLQPNVSKITSNTPNKQGKVFLQLGKTLLFERCYLQLFGYHKPLVLVFVLISKSQYEVGVAEIYSWNQAYFVQTQTLSSSEKFKRC